MFYVHSILTSGERFMRIGFDFDGVITDPAELKHRWILGNCGIDVPPDQTSKKKCIELIGSDAYVGKKVNVHSIL